MTRRRRASIRVKKRGRHSFSVTASIFGITELTPAVYGWRVNRKRR